ncbi:DUF2533 family protein [Paenibacillus sp. YYML68]|uniref:DUF2533 family protein n=1 Tax=Paenibacillus sp. YYML68 TaxID=2909250 RepID=UPI002493AA6C|nr:DUF2533 family protein [Paenibacillus sp. YYML68]
MSNVHQAITAHVSKQNAHLQQFLQLEEARERAIEEAVAACAAGRPFQVDLINRITSAINEHAQQGISPTRVYVTEQMVREHAAKQQV